MNAIQMRKNTKKINNMNIFVVIELQKAEEDVES